MLYYYTTRFIVIFSSYIILYILKMNILCNIISLIYTIIFRSVFSYLSLVFVKLYTQLLYIFLLSTFVFGTKNV